MVMPYSHRHSWKPGKNLMLVVVLLLVLLSGVYAWWSISTDTQVVDDLDFLNVSGLPLAFAPNMGQSDPGVKFQAQSGATSLFLTNDGLTMVWPVARTEAGGNAAALSMHFLDVNPDLDVVTGNALPGTVNYLRGNDAANWYANVATYGTVTYRQFYAGVNLHYTSEKGQLVTLFEVAPGTSPEVIRWTYDDDVLASVDETTGDLLLSLKTVDKTTTLPYVMPAPKAWQMVDGDRLLINAHYSMAANGQVSLNVKRSLDSAPLFIEQTALRTPEDIGPAGWEIAGDITVDAGGNIYLTGTTISSDFPSTATPWTGEADAFITKIAPDGSAILFSTYLGGQLDDRGEGIAVDNTGHVYVTGMTVSSDFPLQMPYQPVKVGYRDVFVSKLMPDGSSLVYSTYLGGSWGDQVEAIAVDTMGQAYVTGMTEAHNFPLMNPYQGYDGTASGFITKFNTSGTALVFSTYFGGSGIDSIETIAVDQAHTVFVAGYTTSSDFPLANPYQSVLQGSADGFLTRFAASGNSLIYSTYLGGGGPGYYNGTGIYDIAVDNVGNVYATGETASSLHPLVNPIQTFGGWIDAFVTKFSPTGSELLYSTYLGGSEYEAGTSIAVDDNNQVHISGFTQSNNFPTVNAVQPNYAGSGDIFITKINSSGSALIFSTYLGGSNEESYDAEVAVTQSGQVNVIADTFSSDFPLVNPYQAQLNGERDIVVAGLAPSGSAFEFSTYLGGSGYLPPTDVTLTGVEGGNPFSNVWLWVVMGVILVVGAWVTRPRTRKPRSVE
jgi:hypothetical protein